MKLQLLILLLFLNIFSGIAQVELAKSKNHNAFIHSIGLNASFDFRIWRQETSWKFPLDLVEDILFSFSQNGLLKNEFSTDRKTLSPLWNLIPYYELGVNNKLFFKIEHYCTYRYVLKNTDLYSLNHSFYIHLRKNVFHDIQNQKHKLLVGGLLGTNLYREKEENEKVFNNGLAPALLVGASMAYYYNFVNKIEVYCSSDCAISFGEIKNFNINPFYSLQRLSFGVQFNF